MKSLESMNLIPLLPIDGNIDIAPENLVYRGVGCEKGKLVPVEEAFSYALQQCGVTLSPCAENAPDYADFREMLVEWYFSGNWVLRTLPE